MRKIFAAGLCACTFLTAGCVGKLHTLPDRATTGTDGALTGFTYALPKVRYEVKLRRSLAECPGSVVDGKPTALKFAVGAEATPTVLAGERYVVDYTELPGWLRTASFEGKLYPNGTLKSIGAAAEDRTAETISSLAKTAFSVATVIGLSDGTLPATATLPSQIVACTSAAASLVNDARQVEADLKAKAKDLETYEKTAERFRAAGAARALDAAGRAGFGRLFDDITRVEGEIAALKKKQSELADELGVTQTIIWEGSTTHPDHAGKAYL